MVSNGGDTLRVCPSGCLACGDWLDPMRDLPSKFVTRVIDVHGHAGEAWLAVLPAQLDRVASRWGLELQGPFAELHTHYVTAATRSDGSHFVLKMAIPGIDVEREAACLRTYSGQGAARLVAYDLGLGALLTERIQPGFDLTHLDEDRAIEVTCRLMDRLHKSPNDPDLFPSVADWGKGFARLRELYGGTSGPLPDDLVSEAQTWFWDLAGSMAPSVLLHGDLHHGNVLSAGDQRWLAIDPQGVIGEPAYEVGAFLRNPTPDIAGSPDLGGILARRVSLFSEAMATDQRRIGGWGFAQAVLSAIWSLEDHGAGWEPAIAVAVALRDLLV